MSRTAAEDKENGLEFGAQVMARLETLAEFSADPDGLTRAYLSPQHKAAGETVAAWMTAAGMIAGFDAIGNVVGRYEGTRPGLRAVMLGSHLDTVRNAGKYDGILGVVSAIACVDALNRAGERLPFAIEVLGFGDEEGTRFPSTLLGSRAVAGTLDTDVLELRDTNDVTLDQALRDFDFDPARVGALARRPEDLHAYVELHIEQGPVLEAAGVSVGVVTAIAGAERYIVTVTGMAGHAGTVPMALRRDALTAAAEIVLVVEARCAEPGGRTAGLVGTVGKISVPDGAPNVIPGGAHFTLDVRAGDDAVRQAAIADISQDVATIAAKRGVTIQMEKVHEAAACVCAPRLIDRLAAAVERHGVAVHRLPSGAGHDATALAAITDVGMLFVRCKGGISHHPDESITAADADTGVRVLLDFIRNFVPHDLHQDARS